MKFPQIIDSSILSSWKSCPALFNLSYLGHWKAKGESVHLVAGKAFAKGLEVARKAFFTGELVRPGNPQEPGLEFHDGKSPLLWTSTQSEPVDAETAVALGLRALMAEYGDFECPADSAKSLDRMMGAFEFYFSHYPLTRDELFPILLPGGRRAIEFSFAHPLPILHPDSGDPLLFCGRMDAILDYSGSAMICDEKTTSSLGPTWSRQWDLRGQFMGYAWGCREAGIKVQGAVIRGVSILKSKYETQQAIIFHPDWMIDRWYAETLFYISQMVEAYKRNCFVHNLDSSCSSYGGCGFRLVCSSQEQNSWLDTYFEQREWNPLLRTETKLGED